MAKINLLLEVSQSFHFLNLIVLIQTYGAEEYRWEKRERLWFDIGSKMIHMSGLSCYSGLAFSKAFISRPSESFQGTVGQSSHLTEDLALLAVS